MLVADFLDESAVESPVLDDIASLVLCRATCEEELAGHLSGADAIMLFHDIPRLGEASFARAPQCKCVVRAGVGYNNVDLAAASRHGVVVCNVPDYGTEEVADHAIMFLLALAHRLVPCHQAIRSGAWHYQSAVGTPRLRGKTLGLIGCGRIGTATALRAKALGLDVVFHDPHLSQGMDKALGIRRVYSLDELLEQSHFVSAAGLDVVEREPLDDPRLRDHPRILFTPHSAFYSVEGFIELRTKTAEEVRRILLGEPPRNPVNLGTPPCAQTS